MVWERQHMKDLESKARDGAIPTASLEWMRVHVLETRSICGADPHTKQNTNWTSYLLVHGLVRSIRDLVFDDGTVGATEQGPFAYIPFVRQYPHEPARLPDWFNESIE